jgi:polygalacturonase
MLTMNQCRHVIIKDIHFYNSPQFHLRLHDIVNYTIHGIEIKAGYT